MLSHSLNRNFVTLYLPFMTIQLDNLQIGYHRRKQPQPIAPPLHATASEGQLTLLVGANGTGKSTLLRTIARLQQPLGGDICIDTKNIRNLTREQLARTIAIVLTEKISIPSVTVEQIVATGRAPYTNHFNRLNADDQQEIDHAIEIVGLQQLRSKYFNELSDGEQQKTLIAKAIAQATPVILLDEPTAFLDYPTKQQCIQIMRQLAHEHGKTIILSTHDLDLALPQADSVWFMQHGKDICQQTPEKLEQLPDFQLFLKKKA